jgi:hypothetical protein
LSPDKDGKSRLIGVALIQAGEFLFALAASITGGVMIADIGSDVRASAWTWMTLVLMQLAATFLQTVTLVSAIKTPKVSGKNLHLRNLTLVQPLLWTHGHTMCCKMRPWASFC